MNIEELLKEDTTLTMDPFAQESRETIVEETPEEPVTYAEERYLTEEEKAQVESFVEQIDLKNSASILSYGAAAQGKMSDFSEGTLEQVRAKDLGEIGNLLNQVVTEIKGFEEPEQKGFGGFFKKKVAKAEQMKLRYNKAEVNIEKITKALESHQIQLMKDSVLLDQLYELNLKYFKELNMYILAGKKKLATVAKEDLPALRAKAASSGLAEDAQEVRDMEGLYSRFEKKVHDLELTRMISLQMAPQIRMIQTSDQDMAEKIQSTIANTIPLWKNQMVLALGIAHSRDAAKAQRMVTDMTNELLKKNAQQLKTAVVETAKETERGIVDMETLVQTNEELITTIDEVIKIQKDGRAKRQEAEAQLTVMEEELKKKLLS